MRISEDAILCAATQAFGAMADALRKTGLVSAEDLAAEIDARMDSFRRSKQAGAFSAADVEVADQALAALEFFKQAAAPVEPNSGPRIRLVE